MIIKGLSHYSLSSLRKDTVKVISRLFKICVTDDEVYEMRQMIDTVLDEQYIKAKQAVDPCDIGFKIGDYVEACYHDKEDYYELHGYYPEPLIGVIKDIDFCGHNVAFGVRDDDGGINFYQAKDLRLLKDE